MEALMIATQIARSMQVVSAAIAHANVPDESDWYYGFDREAFVRQCNSGLRAWLEYGK